ncbi:MAG TPA: Uma2 family endonuclease [Blastocatellia bacterium]|jgi:Uma2 family endonuclease|nr:Uma2 family endonuclease [Blastocatellia bacterium]
MAETDLHRNLILEIVFALSHFFRNDPNVYVSGNLFIYYDKKNPKKNIAPDVFVVRGAPKGDRRVYYLWEEGVAPQIVIEISSQHTFKEDVFKKFHTYEKLAVREYFIFDPTSDYIKDSPLIGFRLEDREYVEMELKDDRLHSDELGLDLVIAGTALRLFDPLTGKFLLTPDEEAEARMRAEAEVERLRAEIELLKQKP